MTQGADIVDRRPSADGKPLSARGKVLIVGISAVLGGLAWLSWRWNGAVVGVPVVIGFLLGAIYRLTRPWGRATSRRPAWDRLVSLLFAGAAVLCGNSLWGSPRLSPGQLDRTAVFWMAGMAVVTWALERRERRRMR